MKIGIGLYNHQLNEDYFKFAEQAGCTDVVIHLATYYNNEIVTATKEGSNYGKVNPDDQFWTREYIQSILDLAKKHNLNIAAVENFNPADWYDILLDGPNRQLQIEKIKKIIVLIGELGITTIGYNFSLAGVWGHQKKPVARGGAISACFDATELNVDSKIQNGEIWNMVYEPGLKGYIKKVTSEQLWDRLRRFLEDVLPTAEKAGVTLALHPDDPPFEGLRQTPRLVYQPDMYQKVIDLNSNKSNQLEFCMGSIQEMSEGDIYQSIEKYASQDRISYVHLRNVKGKVPKYEEVFIDEGDIDIIKALRLLKKNNFNGVLIPDHTPSIQSGDGWRTGMAYALGYIKAALTIIEED